MLTPISTSSPVKIPIWQLRLDPKYVNLMRGIKTDFENGYDAVVCIEGPYGSGKTTLSAISAALISQDFTFEDNMILGQENIKAASRLLSLIDNLPPFSPIVADEAQDIAHKQDWYSSVSKIVNRRMGKARKKFKAVFLNISDINEFNRFFRNQRIDYYIEIIARNMARKVGVAVVWYKDRTIKRDCWRTEEKEALMEKHFKGWDRATIGPQQILEAYQNFPNFGFWFEFPPLPEDIYAHYLELVEAQPDESLEFSLTAETATRLKLRKSLGLLIKVLIDQKLMDQKEIAGYLDYSPAQVNILLREAQGRPIDRQAAVPDFPVNE